ncbi:MAG: hypothetical protein QM747_18285 [Nocardioides sp.]
MTTDAAQRKLLEALAGLHALGPDEGPLLSFVVGVTQAQEVALAAAEEAAFGADEVFDVYTAIADLALAVHADLTEVSV